MNRITKFAMFAIILPIIMIISACSCVLGVCTIQFETWGGSEVKEKSFEPGYQLSTKDFEYTKPTKTGYKFVNWCYKEDLVEEISFPMYCDIGKYTYFAKYEIDMDYFNSTSFVASLSNIQDEITIEDSLVANDTLIFLLDKTITTSSLNKIHIEPMNAIPGQGLMIEDIQVYDENGKPVKDANTNSNTFEPETILPAITQHKYVIKIKAGFKGGDYKLTIN